MSNYDERVADFQRRLREMDADGAVLSTGANLTYLAGVSGEEDRYLLLLVVPGSDPTFVSPTAYAGQVERDARVGEVRSVPGNTPKAVADGLAAALPEVTGTYLIDDRMRVDEFHAIRSAVPEASLDLSTGVVESMRRRKDEAELDRLRRAARLTDEVSREIRELGAAAIGMTERDLANAIRARLHERGAEGVAFPPVVAAGSNGARPTTYRHGDREIASGEPVVLDFGAFFDHYASDQTRTVVFAGDPPGGFVEAHGVVEEALDAGIAAAEPGAAGADVDAAAREVIEDAGYGEAFTTGTGHGVGLRGHEPPSIVPESTDTLERGSVFTVEPGIYLEDEWGVRLETVVALTDDGAEPLNTSPRGWRPL